MKKRMMALAMTGIMAIGLLSGCGGASSSTSSSSGSSEAASSSSAASGDLTECTLAFSTWIGYGPFFVAKELGYFEENGVDMNLTIIDDESQFAASLASDAIQGLAHVIDREIISYDSGVEEQCVLALDQSSGGDGIVASQDVAAAADLEGKTVALDKSSTAYFFFLNYLEENGMTEDQVTISDMGADAAGTSFVNGEVDAAVTWEPWLTNANQREGGHVLASSADYSNVIVDVMTMNQKFIDANPEAVSGICKAWCDAVAYTEENPEESYQYMADGLGITVDEAKDMATGVTYYGKEDNTSLFDTASETNLVDLAATANKFWSERGIIEEEKDPSTFITGEYLPK